VGANAPSANRANVRPAIAGAEPELADLGRVSFGVHAPFFGRLVAAGSAFVSVGGSFFAAPL
jgi:hypothetical protein